MASSSVGNGPNTVSTNCDTKDDCQNTVNTSCDAKDDCQMLPNPSFRSNIDVDEIVEPTSKKTKTLISNVWNCFVKNGVGKDGKEKCKCKAYRK